MVQEKPLLILIMEYSHVSKKIRERVLKMIFESGSSHIGSAFSCVDILTVLYFNILSIDPKNPLNSDRDRFILSKGHAASALYAALAERGFFPEENLDSYCRDKSNLPGHPTLRCVPGVEASTGSLGHGLAIGSGMAFAGKKDNKNYRVFVLMSDGECNEGSVWESAMFSAHHKLDNLIGIIDYNKLQAMGRTDEVIGLEPLRKKWESFGWAVEETDGHNHSEIEKRLKKTPFKKDKPSLIIAHTTKGKGVSFMEDKLEWHYKSPDKEQFAKALKELRQL